MMKDVRTTSNQELGPKPILHGTDNFGTDGRRELVKPVQDDQGLLAAAKAHFERLEVGGLELVVGLEEFVEGGILVVEELELEVERQPLGEHGKGMVGGGAKVLPGLDHAGEDGGQEQALAAAGSAQQHQGLVGGVLEEGFEAGLQREPLGERGGLVGQAKG